MSIIELLETRIRATKNLNCWLKAWVFHLKGKSPLYCKVMYHRYLDKEFHET